MLNYCQNRNLKNPPHFSNYPLHGSQVEEHGEKEANEVEDAQGLKDEDGVHRLAQVQGLGDLVSDGGLVSDRLQVEGRLVAAAEVAVKKSGSGIRVVQKHFNLFSKFLILILILKCNRNIFV